MAISFVGFSGRNSLNGTTGNIDLASPTSGSAPSDGDLCIGVSYCFDRGGNEGRLGDALSYNPLVDNTAGTYRMRVYWKNFVTGEELVSQEGSGNSSDGIAGQIFTFRGHDSTTPIDVTPTEANATSTNPDPPAIVPVSNDCMILVLGGGGMTTATDTTPGTMTNYTTMAGRAAADTNAPSINTARRLLTGGAGASEDPPAWTSWGSSAWVVVTIAIRPAGAATGQPYAKRMGGVTFVQGFRRGQNTNLWRKAGELLLPSPSLIRV